jgi:hypothetical protein
MYLLTSEGLFEEDFIVASVRFYFIGLPIRATCHSLPAYEKRWIEPETHYKVKIIYFLSPKFANDTFRTVLCMYVSSVHKRWGKSDSFRLCHFRVSRTEPDACICRVVNVYDAKYWIFKWDVCQGPASEISMRAVRTNALVGVHSVPVIEDEMKPPAAWTYYSFEYGTIHGTES